MEDASALQTPEQKVFTDRKLWVAMFLGGPLVAGYIFAENFKAFGELGKAKKPGSSPSYPH